MKTGPGHSCAPPKAKRPRGLQHRGLQLCPRQPLFSQPGTLSNDICPAQPLHLYVCLFCTLTCMFQCDACFILFWKSNSDLRFLIRGTKCMEMDVCLGYISVVERPSIHEFLSQILRREIGGWRWKGRWGWEGEQEYVRELGRKERGGEKECV